MEWYMEYAKLNFVCHVLFFNCKHYITPSTELLAWCKKCVFPLVSDGSGGESAAEESAQGKGGAGPPGCSSRFGSSQPADGASKPAGWTKSRDDQRTRGVKLRQKHCSHVESFIILFSIWDAHFWIFCTRSQTNLDIRQFNLVSVEPVDAI